MAFSFNANTTTRPSLFGATQPSGGLFGQPASSAPTGFAFGQPTQSAATTGFGGFGAATTAAHTGFGGFGAATTSSSAPAFGFGAAAPAATQQSLGGFGGFGAATNTSSGGGFQLGATPAAGAFGGGLAAGGTTGFGLNTTTSAVTGFGTGLGLSTGGLGTGFGTAGASTGFGAGSMFGPKPAATTAGLSGLFAGQQASIPQQAQQQTSPSTLEQLAAAVKSPILFGDERDSVISKWNQLQAFWGMGRAYYNQQGQAVELTPHNPYSLFKAVGYVCIPTAKNEDGLVALVINKKMDEVKVNQQQIVDALHRIFGSKPNLSVCVDGLRPLLDENKTELTFFVQDRSATGTTTRITASDVQVYLGQPMYQQQLTGLLVGNVYPKSGMKSDQLKLYLDTPPSGMDPRIWDQAKLDNPDPNRFIPVPMVGFEELRNRLKHQCQQTDLHLSRLDLLSTDISTLQHNLSDMIAKLDQYKRAQLLLSHRVLKILVGQEIHRKHGYAIQPNEEQLRAHLESIAAELNAPTQFKGRLNELMSQLRLQQNQMSSARLEVNCQLDKNVQLELRQHLKQQQEGLKNLIDIINRDMEDLQIIEQGMSSSNNKLRR